MAGGIQKRQGKRGVSYLVRVEFPPDPATGERRQRAKSFKTRKEAERARAEWLVEIERGTAVEPDRLTVADLFAQWLAAFKATNPKEGTVVEYERIVRTKILPGLGSVPVQQLHPLQIDAFYAQLREAGASSDAIHRVHQRLRQAFKYAMRKRLLAVNPLLAVDPPTVRSRPGLVLTVPQIRHFLRVAAGDGYSPLWLLLVQTGMRRGEALGLRWQDVDWERKRIHVHQCVEVLGGVTRITTPKTPAALRSITLFPESVAALAAHRKRQLARRLAAGADWEDRDLIFTTPQGRALNPGNVLRNLAVIQRKANAAPDVPDAARLPHFTVHDLRHTHATHLLMDGWSVAVVSRRLGHASPAITLQLYAHAIADVHGDEIVTPAAFALTGTE
ncbi:MAG TPA: site-specific integrase [Thermomicrobiales bacterium]|nr:site-specific integrase [Thermomicrobiales bacterium]